MAKRAVRTEHPRSGAGVDVCVDQLGRESPECPHGPTILFQRYVKKNKHDQTHSVKRFYACSAYRDRKYCNFYQGADESVSEARLQLHQQTNSAIRNLPYTHEKYHTRLNTVKGYPESERRYCMDCDLLYLTKEKTKHDDHNKVMPISDEQLGNPMSIVKPKETNKTNAQFIFTNETKKQLVDCLEEKDLLNVICIGTPSLHHYIQNSKPKMNSLLMDIDHRFMQFYGPNSYIRYNMFNHFFFDDDQARRVYNLFLQQGKVVLILDPPFGGLVDLLAKTIEQITSDHKENSQEKLAVYWVFPYFMERRILSVLPDMTMLDHSIEYENHGKFQDKKNKKSPVRVFTNMTKKVGKSIQRTDIGKVCHICGETGHERKQCQQNPMNAGTDLVIPAAQNHRQKVKKRRI